MLEHDADAAELRGRIAVRDELLTEHGIVHGGVFAGAAEAIASTGTALVVMGAGNAAMGLSNDTTVLADVRDGTIHLLARAVQPRRARVGLDRGRDGRRRRAGGALARDGRRAAAAEAAVTHRAAIVGAGPAGFYATDQLLEAGWEVDLYDALPTPFGLVRSGVAPDHPKLKSVTRIYEKTAAKPGFRFFGGVALGERRHARGAAGALPRGGLRGRHGRRQPARDPGRGPARLALGHRVRRLVQRPPGLRRPRVRPLRRARGRDRQRQRRDRRRAHARARPGGVAPTDTADHAIERSAARRSRRWCCSAAAGPRRRRSRTPRSASSASCARAEWSSTPPGRRGRRAGDADRRSATSSSSASTRRASRRASRTGSSCASCAPRSRSSARARTDRSPACACRSTGSRTAARCPTGEEEVIECGLVLRSIGYRGRPLDGVPFDERRGLIRNEGGRVCEEGGRRASTRRLDQARPERRDRHEQEGRRRHRRADPRGRRAGALNAPPRPTRTRSSHGSPSARPTPSRGRAGRRSTRPSAARASPRAARG